jgi:hypothetical protein
MSRTVSASGPHVVGCLAEARRLLGLRLVDSREISRSGGDGLWRVVLQTEDVVECTIDPRRPVQAEILG